MANKQPDKCHHEDLLHGRCVHCGKDLGHWIQQQAFLEIARLRKKQLKEYVL